VKRTLVKTTNYERFRTAITDVEGRGAPETGMILVTGKPGVSKSTIVDRWAVETKAIYLCAEVRWTPHRFEDALAAALKVDTTGRRSEMYGRVIGAIARGVTPGGPPRPIVIDEIQRTLREEAVTLDAIRQISDLTETITVLVAGDDRVLQRIKRFPAIARRINRVVQFDDASLDDVRKMCEANAEADWQEDAIAELHRQSAGNMGHVCNGMVVGDRVAKLNGKRKLTLADLRGVVLVEDWQAQVHAGARVR
jgi:hypothetical protein